MIEVETTSINSDGTKGCDMKKLGVIGLVLGAACAMFLLVRKRRSSENPDEREERRTGKRRAMFERMQEGMDAMPEDFPPVVMFNNIAATRKNSERILELLEYDRSQTEEPVAAAN